MRINMVYQDVEKLNFYSKTKKMVAKVPSKTDSCVFLPTLYTAHCFI